MTPISNFDKEMIQKQKLNLRPSGYETEEVNMALAQRIAHSWRPW